MDLLPVCFSGSNIADGSDGTDDEEQMSEDQSYYSFSGIKTHNAHLMAFVASTWTSEDLCK